MATAPTLNDALEAVFGPLHDPELTRIAADLAARFDAADGSR